MRVKRLVPVAAVLGGVAFLLHMHLAAANQYQVQEGDTLSELAARLGVSVQALAAANGLTDPDLIVAGQMLVVPSDGGSATEYLVRDGDTLAGISASVGVPVRDLMKANGLDDPNWVPAGRLLSVPPVGATVISAAPVGGGGTYRVREGDTLAGIASRFGVTVGQLASTNGITNPNLITVGQVITAPNSWLCPVPSASFVNDYGYVRDDGGKHNGVDLFAVRGAPIQAPVAGLVERYPNPAGGRAIELYGNDGNRYYFAHLNEYEADGYVAAGEIVGYVGNSGDAAGTSTHLHFEIHPGGGNAVNPFPTLVAACR